MNSVLSHKGKDKGTVVGLGGAGKDTWTIFGISILGRSKSESKGNISLDSERKHVELLPMYSITGFAAGHEHCEGVEMGMGMGAMADSSTWM